jgi:hypothetical protein
MSETKMEIVWIQNLKGFIEGKFTANERWKEIFIEQLDRVNEENQEERKQTAALLNEQPAAKQWRARIKGGAWDAWENGRYGQEVPPFMEVEERDLYPASALTSLMEENERLKEENGQLIDENSDLRYEPWPEWAKAVLSVIRKHSGYDGYDDATEGVDMPLELSEHLSEMEAHLSEMEAEADRWKNKAEAAEARAQAAEQKLEKAVEFLKLYRTKTPIGHQPHLIAGYVDAFIKEAGE